VTRFDPPLGAAGDVDHVAAETGEVVAGALAAPAHRADEVHGAVAGHLVGPVGDLGQRDEDRTGHVRGLVLVGIAHIDDGDALGVQAGQCGDVDLGDGHRCSWGGWGRSASVVLHVSAVEVDQATGSRW
jgi:hypothetical protein